MTNSPLYFSAPDSEQLVAVRLSLLEQSMENTKDVLETIQKENHEHRTVHNKETREIYTKMDELRKELKDDLSTLKDNLDKKLDKITSKLDEVERWRWIAIGAAMTVGFLISNLDKVVKALLT